MTSRGRPASRQDLPRSDGLTILELLIALPLLAVVVGGLYRFVATGSQSARLTNNFLQIQAQARAALDNVVDEIRWGQQVTAAGPTSVTVLVPQATPFSPPSPYIVTFAYAAPADAGTRRGEPDAGGAGPGGSRCDCQRQYSADRHPEPDQPHPDRRHGPAGALKGR